MIVPDELKEMLFVIVNAPFHTPVPFITICDVPASVAVNTKLPPQYTVDALKLPPPDNDDTTHSGLLNDKVPVLYAKESKLIPVVLVVVAPFADEPLTFKFNIPPPAPVKTLPVVIIVPAEYVSETVPVAIVILTAFCNVVCVLLKIVLTAIYPVIFQTPVPVKINVGVLVVSKLLEPVPLRLCVLIVTELPKVVVTPTFNIFKFKSFGKDNVLFDANVNVPVGLNAPAPLNDIPVPQLSVVVPLIFNELNVENVIGDAEVKLTLFQVIC